MSQPDWIITTIIGVIAGYLLPYMVNAIGFLARRFQRDLVEGKWYVYHTTRRNDGFCVEPSIWNIRKGFRTMFVVETTRIESKNLVYKGLVQFERNFWLVRFRGIKHEEEVSVRLYNPIPSADEVTWGLYLAIDFQGNPIAGPVVISRKEISDSEIIELVKKKTNVFDDMRMLSA